MHVPYKSLVVSCLLGMLSIPIMGCGGSAGANATSPSPGAPSITWSTPAPIQYGAALGSVQLDASANVAGNVHILTCRRHGAPGGIAEAHGHLHTFRQHHLFHSYCQRATFGYPSHSGGHLGTVNSHSPRDHPRNSAVGCHGECARHLRLTVRRWAHVLPMGAQQLTATFTPSDATDYTSVTAHDSLTVTAPVPSAPTVTWNTPAPIQYGTALEQCPTRRNSQRAGRLCLHTRCRDGASRRIPEAHRRLYALRHNRILPQRLRRSAYSYPEPHPVINWAALSPVQQGAPPSAEYSWMPRRMCPAPSLYSPAAGTVLPAGTQQLTVTFTPSNTTDYMSAVASNSLTVTPGSTGPTPVNGACGPANGTTANVAPSANLCTAGTASPVTGTGPWTWQCTGSQRWNNVKLYGFASHPGRSFRLSADPRDQYPS